MESGTCHFLSSVDFGPLERVWIWESDQPLGLYPSSASSSSETLSESFHPTETLLSCKVRARPDSWDWCEQQIRYCS